MQVCDSINCDPCCNFSCYCSGPDGTVLARMEEAHVVVLKAYVRQVKIIVNVLAPPSP
jgi:hypothetical protein